MENQFDVVIVGASFSGLTLAHHLPKGLKVLVVDTKPAAGSTVESTGLITEKTRQEFAEFFDIEKYLTNSMSAICVMAPDFENYFISSTDEPWIYQTDTKALVKALADTTPDNVEVRMETVFVDVETSDSGVTAVRLRTNGSGEETIETKFLVGADGCNSKVGAVVDGLDENQRFLFGYEQVYYGQVNLGDNPEETVYHFWFGEFSLGYGGWLSPTEINGRTAFRIGLAKLKGEHGETKDLTTKFTEELAKRGYVTIDEGVEEPGYIFGSFIPISGALNKISWKNALLIGDAAGFCGAFAADGIKGSVISGKEAAPLITKYLQGDKQAINSFKDKVNSHGKLLEYYNRQTRYRMIWDAMKSDRTFKAMYDIIEGQKESFLDKFCDNKDRHKSLAWTVIKFDTVPKAIKYAWFIFLDQIKP